ncbi:MAG: transketolase C-terminal domain-containing protein [Acetobacter sp.]|uniref:transketolase-like TK C-terminal-containing protein n=1 Tax=Acetobacter sp. TaxID=440 RepID=UPI0039EB6973
MPAFTAPDPSPRPPAPQDSLNPQDALTLRLDRAARENLAQNPQGNAHLPELATLCLPVTALWCRVLRHDPTAPDWPDRDRFVVPSLALQPLLHAMLRLTGAIGPGMDAMPEFGAHPAVEVAPGPAGQGVAAAAGMALAEQILARRHGRSLVNHRVWVMARDTDLLTGVALEAAQLAGRFGLNRLTVLVSPGSQTDTAEFSDSLDRFSASGWSVRSVNAHNLNAVSAALNAATRARKPTLIACMPTRTAPAMPGSAPPATVAEEEQVGPWSPTARRGASLRRSWLRRLARHRGRDTFEREVAAIPPPLLTEDWLRLWRQALHTLPAKSSQQAALAGLHALEAVRPELGVLAASSGSGTGRAHRHTAQNATQHAAHNAARNTPAPWPCGLQEHGMAGMLNGMALHGGVLPCGVAGMITIDRMRSALRMAALMRRKVLYLLTDDGLALSDGGAGWQPVEQLASLRAMPHLAVFRPAFAEETFACWQAALDWVEGPAVLVLCPHEEPRPPAPQPSTPQVPAPHGPPPQTPSAAGQTPPRGESAPLAQPELPTEPGPTMRAAGPGRFGTAAHGGYLLCGDGTRDVTLMATGPEVGIALHARTLLAARGLRVAVASIPCWEAFSRQTPAYRMAVLGDTGLRVGIEAANSFGWERWLGQNGIFIGMDDFGISAPANAVYERFGITAEAVCAKVLERLALSTPAEEPQTPTPTLPRSKTGPRNK